MLNVLCFSTQWSVQRNPNLGHLVTETDHRVTQVTKIGHQVADLDHQTEGHHRLVRAEGTSLQQQERQVAVLHRKMRHRTAQTGRTSPLQRAPRMQGLQTKIGMPNTNHMTKLLSIPECYQSIFTNHYNMDHTQCHLFIHHHRHHHYKCHRHCKCLSGVIHRVRRF